MIPSPGRIVAYTLTIDDAVAVRRRRTDAASVRRAADGAIVHVGNDVHPGEEYPMLIVRTWPNPHATSHTEDDLVNGQVFLDGNDHLWVTSRAQGTGPGQWHELPRVAQPVERRGTTLVTGMVSDAVNRAAS